jgi:osmotically-inducible protein OsmY
MGSIVAAVVDGVVTLSGEVPTLAQNRLAGVLACGRRAVETSSTTNHLPAEIDDDDKVTEAVQLALEKDPFINATKIRVSTRDWTVTLEGLVANEAMQLRAVRDSWYVAGVKNVVNKLGLK